MPTEEQKKRADTIERYVFFGAIILCFLAFVIQLITKNKMLGIRIFITSFWLVFATHNFATFYTGRLRWKNGPTITREHSPISFYASALFFCAGSMGFATFVLWKAYTSE